MIDNTTKNYMVSVGIMDNINGYSTHRKITPDSDGFYEVVVGCINMPTRANVIYEPQSVLACLTDPDSKFQVMLRSGGLTGTYFHPDILGQDDMWKLFKINEKYVSHYFKRIWTSDTVTIDGFECIPIRALVHPTGPYGEHLEKEFKDTANKPVHFSVRSLCSPLDRTDDPRFTDRKYSFRKMEMLITFDHVFCPGFTVASTMYNTPGTESYEYPVTRRILEDAYKYGNVAGMESTTTMITDRDIAKLYNDRELSIDGEHVGSNISGTSSLLGSDGHYRSASSLVYNYRSKV